MSAELADGYLGCLTFWRLQHYIFLLASAKLFRAIKEKGNKGGVNTCYKEEELDRVKCNKEIHFDTRITSVGLFQKRTSIIRGAHSLGAFLWICVYPTKLMCSCL